MLRLTRQEAAALIGLLNVRLAQIHSHKYPWALVVEEEAALLSGLLDRLEQLDSAAPTQYPT